MQNKILTFFPSSCNSPPSQPLFKLKQGLQKLLLTLLMSSLLPTSARQHYKKQIRQSKLRLSSRVTCLHKIQSLKNEKVTSWSLDICEALEGVVAQWQHIRLQSCSPGFECGTSPAHSRLPIFWRVATWDGTWLRADLCEGRQGRKLLKMPKTYKGKKNCKALPRSSQLGVHSTTTDAVPSKIV